MSLLQLSFIIVLYCIARKVGQFGSYTFYPHMNVVFNVLKIDVLTDTDRQTD